MIYLLLSFSTLAQNVPEMNFEQLKPYLNKNNDTVYVVNFWATWCQPCVEELPAFLSVAKELKNDKVKFIFVSLDFPSQKENRLIPYLNKNNFTEQVVLLNDPDSNSWIDKVNSEWSGAIPATIIYKGEKRSFYEKKLERNELINSIKSK